ncbi:MAG TPA: hypothetical protein VJS12_10790 [Steroidobacteraceae bacterium]|nr:hypothetical protein [Steroidobacteraceae bacterium]
MRVVFLLLVLVLPAEASGEPTATRRTLSGWLLAERSHAPGGSHTPIAGYVESATSITDAAGRFEFSGRKSGWYEVVVRCPLENPLAFVAESRLELRRGEYTTYLAYSTAPCDSTRFRQRGAP